ncbi:MAG: hypothetical protein R2751_05620 [Bacteroidales bacterium]
MTRQPVDAQEERWRFALQGGYGVHLFKLEESLPADWVPYYRAMKRGWQESADFQYFPGKHLGLGLRFAQFQTSNHMDSTSYAGYAGEMEDDLRIRYAGPALWGRVGSLNQSNCLSLGLSVGYVAYWNEKILIEEFLLEGSTIGMSLDLSWDWRINDRWALGLQGGFLTAVLQEFKLTEGNRTIDLELSPDAYQGLSRLDFSLGLRFVL